jgi:peptide/nickel transport system permease protein
LTAAAPRQTIQRMAHYLARRLLWSAFAFFVVTVLTFILFFVVPSDPARLFAPSDDPDTIVRMRHTLALDHPLYVQYLSEMKRLLVDHSLGYSFRTRQSVGEALQRAAPVTMALVLGGVLLAALTSFLVGLMSAMRPRGMGDRLAMALVLIGVSVHPVWLGLGLSWLFGSQLGWLPITGYCDFDATRLSYCGGASAWFSHMVLPWITFATLYAALYSRMIRASLLESLQEDYILTAYAKGASRAGVVRRHALRNALLPVITMLGMDIGVAVTGSIFVETVFGLPGIGRLAVASAIGRDLPMTLGIVIMAASAVIILNFLVDALYVVLDPRVRLVGSRA